MRDVDPEKAEGIYQAVSIARWLDLMATDFPEKEYEMYRLLRQHLPVSCMVEGMRGGGLFGDGGATTWFFSRYEDVYYAFHHPEIFSSQIGYRFIPQAVDPPEHTEYRRIMNPWFTQQALTPLEPKIWEFANELIDKMLEKGEFDFVKEFSEPFPIIIFCQVAGFPLEDLPQMMRWKDIFVHSLRAGKAEELGLDIPTDRAGHPKLEPLRQVLAKETQELYAYCNGLIEERRRNPREDILTALVQAKYAGVRPLTQDELLQTLHLFILGGLDTMTSTLGSIMLFFAEHPEKRREFIQLIDDPARVYTAIEELVRYTSIVSPARKVKRDCTYRGLELGEGDLVVLSTASADRDEREFPNPDEVIFDRHPTRHAGFALGPHRCLGMQLARRELRIALQEIHRRMPNYAIKPGERPKPYGGGVKGVEYLPLVVGDGSL